MGLESSVMGEGGLRETVDSPVWLSASCPGRSVYGQRWGWGLVGWVKGD